MKNSYLSKRQLEELNATLSNRDKAILRSLGRCRYLTTGQIRRLHHTDSVSPAAGQRAANWTTAKLKNHGLIETLERRVGGVRGGSQSCVWALTAAGAKLLHLNDTGYTQRKRFFEPSINFLNHTLAVSEIYIRILETCKRYQLDLIQADLEPDSWRDYVEDGKPVTLKPDMFVITAGGEYEDIMFLEVDLNTEAPSRVLEKCRRYVRYHSSGIEKKRYDVFPLVVWLVNSESRKNTLKEYLAEEKKIPEVFKGIFAVIMTDELETLITSGMEALTEKGAA